MARHYMTRALRSKKKEPVSCKKGYKPLEFKVCRSSGEKIKDIFEKAYDVLNIKSSKSLYLTPLKQTPVITKTSSGYDTDEQQRDYTPSQVLWETHRSVRKIFGIGAESPEQSQELFSSSQEVAKPCGAGLVDLAIPCDIMGASHTEANQCIDTN